MNGWMDASVSMKWKALQENFSVHNVSLYGISSLLFIQAGLGFRG